MSGRARPAVVGGVVGLLVGLVLAVVLVVLAPSASGQSAATIDAVGWWTRTPGATAPEGGIAVGQAPDGPLSVAALLVSVGGAVPERAVLRLTEDSGVGQADAALQVCVTTDPWEPAAGGPMAEAPQAACDAGSVALRRTASGSWGGDVAPLLGEGTMSLMIVPAAGEDPTPSSFHASFNPPALDAAVPPPPSPSETTTTVATTTTTTEAPSAAPPEPGRSPPTTAFSLPPPPTSPPPPPSPSLPGYDDAATPTTPLPARQASVSGGGGTGGTGTPWNKGIILIGIASVVGSLAGAGRNQLRRRNWLSLDA